MGHGWPWCCESGLTSKNIPAMAETDAGKAQVGSGDLMASATATL